MRWFWLLLFVILVGLQYRIWVGEGSLAEISGLKDRIDEQREQNQKLRERNELLKAEVSDLKQGLEAIEERARTELGMIKDGETFYQLLEPGKELEPRAEVEPEPLP